ncbi:TonB-dependent hemoglobin/transferrin/lactoferrin family receptor [Ignatzschineria ureiclastica]|uniref:TonB-dependent hemoglobin/transferrin/lactoferrin family receptor n=1 Tax=Ignatzschineria ureiclastica TaxID=472582 RepID=A0A2U2AH76_9GAMM|nr:TonB-dependent hemoglobin/transferrin/lactoferrin family receptor [Ignatzschineria ureiclastica]PWD82008.1 TonB-dependent hemoglobin/transferrin/lactoferrin family receptor [Ignatzschineria ureiclastica]GGZ91989.1 heme/hemoglobin uptake outer membrane receptor PhuR [Ignatzschineria ureiclastica]
MYKRSLLSLCVSSLLFSPFAMAQTPAWVTDNTENAEGIVTPNAHDEPTPPTVALSKVVITGALKEELAIAESAATIAHFGVQEVDRLNATNLADLLTYEPGVTVDLNKSGGLSDIRIRGIGEDRVLISVDGAPLPITYSFGSYLATSRNYFDIDAMKSIDIIKGPMSTLYGGSALAGGIFMQTKDPSDFIRGDHRFGGEVKAGYRTATRETLLSGTVAGRLTDTLSAFARLTYTNPKERENYQGKASSEDQLGPNRTHPNKSEADNYNFLTKWVFEPNADHRFSLTYENFKETLDTDPLSKFNSVTYGTTFLNMHTKDTNKRQQVTLRHDFNQGTALFDRGFWNIYYQNSKASQDHHETRYAARTGETYRTRYGNFNNKSYGFGAEFTKGIAQNEAIFHNLTYGINYRHSKVTTERTGDTISRRTGQSIETEAFPNKSFPDSKIKELGIFLQDRISFYDGQFEAIAGIRYDHYKLNPKAGSAFEAANPGVLPPDTFSKSQFSKRFALLWHPTEENTLFFNYSEGFRAPTFSAVNVGFSNTNIGYTSRSNPNLKPETSKSYELGWNYLDDTKSFSVTGFYTDYKNFIEELNFVGIDPSSGYMVYQAINLGKSKIYGVEAKASMDLFTIQNGNGTIGFHASLAYAKGKEKGTNNPINSVEPLTAVVGIDYNYLDQLYLSARVKAVQAKRDRNIKNGDDPRMPRIPEAPGYATVDLIAEYKPTRGVTINAGLYNILDKEYWSWSERMTAVSTDDLKRASNPGFNAALSVKYEF